MDKEFAVLVGKTLSAVAQTRDEIRFTTTEGEIYRQYHYQDCCEAVTVEDVVGDWEDIIGQEIIEAREDVSEGEASSWESSTWTFYTIRTNRGTVTIRWLGTSNGYYSESVDFERVEDADA